MLLAIADVEANFIVVSAYQYTSLSSAMLLDCFTIPVVMLLSSIFLEAQVPVMSIAPRRANGLYLLVFSCTLCCSYLLFGRYKRPGNI